MLHSVSGSKLSIARDFPPLVDSAWTEIRSAESLGTVGIEWSTVDATAGDDPHAITIKHIMRPRQMQMTLYEDLDDPGQMVVWQAARSRDDYWFRLRFSGARAPGRQWKALVVAVDEVFDTANSVVKLLVALQLNSDIDRLEGV